MNFSFNVRVYGVLMDEERGILVSDELIRGKNYTKFPGGGMEYGEGTRDCLKREFMEETKIEIEVKEHLYTTDFFQESAFRPNDQIVSVYYFVQPKHELIFPLVHYDNLTGEEAKKPHADMEAFRFIPPHLFSPDKLSFPIDKVVAKLLLSQHVL